MNQQYDIVAIVIAIDHYNALGVIRSLGECGIPVALLLTSTEKSYIEKSKYVNEVYRIKQSEIELEKAIVKIASHYLKCFVITTTDYSALVLDNISEELPDNVVSPSMKGRMLQYQNKDYAKRKALQAGIRIPKGRVFKLDSTHLKWDVFPAIIKPLSSINGLKSDIQRVDNSDQLQEAFKQFRVKGYEEVLVEQFIHGEKAHMVEVMGYTDGCSVVFGRIVKKIREYPINNGSTAFAMFVDKHDDLELDKLEHFIIDSGYVGIFDFEFKSVDGKCYYIECNFRNGAPSYALTRIGCNLPSLWISSMSGLKFNSHTKINKNDMFMCEQTDFLNMVKRNVRLSKWIRDYHISNKLFVNMRDFAPNFSYLLSMLKIVINKVASKKNRRKEDV